MSNEETKKTNKRSIYNKDIDALRKTCDYLILSSVRGTSKSYACKEHVITRYMKFDEEFVYLRRYNDEIKDIDTIDYFSDMNIHKLTNGKYDTIDVFRKRIYLCNFDENDNIIRKKKIGYCFALKEYEKKKSLQYPKVQTIIYEEYCTEKIYVDGEPQRLQHFVSSIFRERKGFCILVGNKMNKFNPYFFEWDLRNGLNQKTGTIDTYTMKDNDGNEVIVKLWDIKKLEKSSGMFFGLASKSIDGNSYYVENQNKLLGNIDDYQIIYMLVVKVQGLMFTMKFLKHRKKSTFFTWYVEPKTSECIKDKTRVISDEYTPDVYYTKGFIPITESEKLLFDYIKRDKVAYCNNRCGTDFKNALNILSIK